jgi:hypothetical protein
MGTVLMIVMMGMVRMRRCHTRNIPTDAGENRNGSGQKWQIRDEPGGLQEWGTCVESAEGADPVSSSWRAAETPTRYWVMARC